MASPEQFWALVCASVFLGSLTTLIVGSQDRADARFVAGLTLGVLAPVVLVILLGLLTTTAGSHGGGEWSGFGFFATLIGAVVLGYGIAEWREWRQPTVPTISDEPIPPDDDLF